MSENKNWIESAKFYVMMQYVRFQNFKDQVCLKISNKIGLKK